ncbi:substrate-binding domain-containing protein [Bifidobacterium adolescentis]|uniref:substrate-binding domain-containing protein n=1 Tax=Bifidobacterium adolescentis TaxID=1680 RepID=UPI0034A18F63
MFCHNDRTALGLYDALRESGKRMPDDISVVGFDNQEVISAHMHPALTTVGLSSVRSRRDGRAYPVASLRSRQ